MSYIRITCPNPFSHSARKLEGMRKATRQSDGFHKVCTELMHFSHWRAHQMLFQNLMALILGQWLLTAKHVSSYMIAVAFLIAIH